jgi:hypothetical protein
MTTSLKPVAYTSAYTVLDASDYNKCLSQIGNQVELIGHIEEVRHDTSRYGKPYVFVNFGDWRGNIVKLSIWSESLPKFNAAISQLAPGQWVSVIGMIEPPYQNLKYRYSHLSINLTQPSQLRFITSSEASHRLGKSSNGQVGAQRVGNQAILEGLRGTTRPPMGARTARQPSPATTPTTPNQAILTAMKQKAGPAQPAGSQFPQLTFSNGRQTPAGQTSKCFVATAVYGDPWHPDVKCLREFRDCWLSRSAVGRSAIRCYEHFGPHLARVVERNFILRDGTRKVISTFVRFLRR